MKKSLNIDRSRSDRVKDSHINQNQLANYPESIGVYIAENCLPGKFHADHPRCIYKVEVLEGLVTALPTFHLYLFMFLYSIMFVLLDERRTGKPQRRTTEMLMMVLRS